MQSFYQHYYKKYIQALQNAADKADRYVVHTMCCVICYLCMLYLQWVCPLTFSAQLTKAYQTANVLFEVLKAVNMTQSMEVDREVIFL